MAHFKQKFPFVLAFFSGMCIMAVELTASRLLAPYFGTSIFVWTNIIAIIMIALSAGYYLGGKISEKKPEISFLLKLLSIAAIITFFIPFVTQPLSLYILEDFGDLSKASLVILFGSFFATLILFFIPIMLMGMVSPYLIKIVSIFHSDVGNVAGSIFAVSTMGSIIGTFLPSLIFIPWVGSKRTIIIFSLVLMLVCLWGFLRKKKYQWLAMLVFLLGPFVVSPTLGYARDIIYETESAYQFIQVQEKGDMRALVYNEALGTQSLYIKDKYITGHMYFDIMAASPALLNKDEIKILNLGLAGGTAVRGMAHLFPDKRIQIDGVEIDDKVIDVAKEYFDLNIPQLSIHSQDARIFTRFAQEKYDLILVDAYSNQIYIPWHMTTEEFFQNLKDISYDHTIIALNLNAVNEDSKLFRAITNTLAKVFPYVYSAPVLNSYNYLIMAGNQPIEFERFLQDPVVAEYNELDNLINYLVENVKLLRYNDQEMILTDDRAPIEHLTDFMYMKLFLENI